MAETLVVGVGNDLRRDDAVGRVAAEHIEGLGRGGTRVISVSQLVPELVEVMASVELVVIVDAALGTSATTVREAVAGSAAGMTHHGSPDCLLALAAVIGVSLPRVFVVGVPASDLGLGEGLTQPTAAHVQEAIVVELLDGHG